MTDVIARLKAERDSLRDRLGKVEAAIEQYERWAMSVAELVGGSMATTAIQMPGDPGALPTPMAEFEKEVRALLDRVAAPLTRGDVHDALVKAGVIVGGKEPLNTVASRLSRMAGITNLRGHGYWPEHRPYGPAGYEGTTAPPSPEPQDALRTDGAFASTGGEQAVGEVR